MLSAQPAWDGDLHPSVEGFGPPGNCAVCTVARVGHNGLHPSHWISPPDLRDMVLSPERDLDDRWKAFSIPNSTEGMTFSKPQNPKERISSYGEEGSGREALN